MNNNAYDSTSSRSKSVSAKRRGTMKTGIPQKVESGSFGSPGLLMVTSRSNSRDNDDDQGGGRKKQVQGNRDLI